MEEITIKIPAEFFNSLETDIEIMCSLYGIPKQIIKAERAQVLSPLACKNFYLRYILPVLGKRLPRKIKKKLFKMGDRKSKISGL